MTCGNVSYLSEKMVATLGAPLCGKLRIIIFFMTVTYFISFHFWAHYTKGGPFMQKVLCHIDSAIQESFIKIACSFLVGMMVIEG